jgi:hypothetical protein
MAAQSSPEIAEKGSAAKQETMKDVKATVATAVASGDTTVVVVEEVDSEKERVACGAGRC